ncbi:hypothetical protein BDV93DRAFT_529303 [Ceratobasidium sp. AG-I]|nr:hypothetical protein BDV93DRAFT_529303 [Ceratobasidium sp. AG-I]
MDVVDAPRKIVVLFKTRLSDHHTGILLRARCLVHECILPYASHPSFVHRIFGRGKPYASEIKAAYEFIVKNYRVGDQILIFDGVYLSSLRQKDRHIAIGELVTALNAGFSPSATASGPINEKVPIKCVFLSSRGPGLPPGSDVLLFGSPSTVENLLCVHDYKYHYDGYVVQRGSYGQVKRKETWYHQTHVFPVLDWLVFHTRHIIDYHPSDLEDLPSPSVSLVSTAMHSNCTKRRKGLPCDDAISTGGRLSRIARVGWPGHTSPEDTGLVWSSQSFADGEYDDVCNAPLVGPR